MSKKNGIITALVKADELLGSVAVSGDGVFAMADARKLLKAAYDEIVREEEVVKEDGG